MTLPAGSDDWIKQRALTGLLVLKGGEIRYENYYQGTTPQDRRISWSVAKSFLSALLGILVDEGALALEDPLTQYVPALKGSAYEGARVIDALHMASGIAFNEDYLDFYSDINKMGRVLALGASMDSFATSQDRVRDAPGASWKYVSIDTHVIAMAIRGATGRNIPSLMQEKLIAPLGLEDDALMITDGLGDSFVLGGLNMRLRDYGRFGQMVLQDGVWQGKRIVPEGWVKRSGTFTAPTAEGQQAYGLHWWGARDPREGEFFARGIYGQYVYINRPQDVVVVVTSADRLFREKGVSDEMVDMLRQIVAAAQS
jgi:CubicO group peptidase (beta-lactamase class C family)